MIQFISTYFMLKVIAVSTHHCYCLFYTRLEICRNAQVSDVKVVKNFVSIFSSSKEN